MGMFKMWIVRNFKGKEKNIKVCGFVNLGYVWIFGLLLYSKERCDICFFNYICDIMFLFEVSEDMYVFFKNFNLMILYCKFLLINYLWK